MLLVAVVALIFKENQNKYTRIAGYQDTQVRKFHKLISGASLPLLLGLIGVGSLIWYLIRTKTEFKSHKLMTIKFLRLGHLLAGVSMWTLAKVLTITGTYVYW